MELLVVEAGVDPGRVHRIPIGIELDRFPLGDDERRAAARASLGLAAGRVRRGLVPEGRRRDGRRATSRRRSRARTSSSTRSRTRTASSTGSSCCSPARRGATCARELERRGVPFVHRLLPDRDGLTAAYHALDAYVVASRQEGGPKSVLESMATGVPLVTTRAGQAPDLVVDGVNGNLVDVEDPVGLAAGLLQARARPGARASGSAPPGAATAEENSHASLAPRWRALLEGFAERPGG